MHAFAFVPPRAAIDEDGAVEGYASLFGEVDQARDMMLAGAFRATLALRGLRRIPMLFQHDPAEPIGIWLELKEDLRGLYARGRLIPDVTRAREVLALVRAGAIDGLSIGFRTASARVDPKTKVRKVAAVDLWEISIVTFPLLAGARVRAVKGVRGVRFSGPPYAAALAPAPPKPKLSPARAQAEGEWRALFAGNAGSPTVLRVPGALQRGALLRRPGTFTTAGVFEGPASAAHRSAALRAAPRAGHATLPFLAKYRPDQPRVPAGNPDGGQWTSDGEGEAQLGQDRFERAPTAADQPARSDLSQLQDIANDPLIRSRIDEAWNASNPHTTSPREHGFWICRNEETGALFTRPFTGPAFRDTIFPGPMPGDAVAFFHTHPVRSDLRGLPGPSELDRAFTARVGLPGLIRSHNGMYYFGPVLRPWRRR